MKKINKRGFTLIELIIIMVVIGVLVLLAMPKFMDYTKKAQTTKLISNIRELETATERYYMDSGDWPKLGDRPLTKEEVTSYAEEIYSLSGLEINLDDEGNYYFINHYFLRNYIKLNKGDEAYIVQNPVGNVYALSKITQVGKDVIDKIEAENPIPEDGETKPTPEPIIGRKQLFSGINHSFMMDENGDVFGWGLNSDGQLGDGTAGAGNYVFNPEKNPFLSDIKQISGGAYHTLALKKDGTVIAWGQNQYNQLGIDEWRNQLSPIQVPELTDVVQVLAGWKHSLALKSDGTVWAWGSGEFGTLGTDMEHNYFHVPTQIEGVSDVVKISGKHEHVVALLENGQVIGWGTDTDGSLGIADDSYSNANSNIRLIKGLDNIIDIATTDYETLIVKDDGTVWGFGENSNGELGNTQKYSATPSQAVGLIDVVSIIGGRQHVLALKSDGTLWGFGNNKYYAIGVGHTSDITVPVKILDDVSMAIAGAWQSVAIKKDGTILSWGEGRFGELGLGAVKSSPTPTIMEFK